MLVSKLLESDTGSQGHRSVEITSEVIGRDFVHKVSNRLRRGLAANLVIA